MGVRFLTEKKRGRESCLTNHNGEEKSDVARVKSTLVTSGGTSSGEPCNFDHLTGNDPLATVLTARFIVQQPRKVAKKIYIYREKEKHDERGKNRNSIEVRTVFTSLVCSNPSLTEARADYHCPDARCNLSATRNQSLRYLLTDDSH